MKASWFILATGNRWEDVPTELGCSGRTAALRLLTWEQLRIWARLHGDLLAALRREGKLDADTVVVDSFTVRTFGSSQLTGPSPVDRRKSGTKRTLVVDGNGVPLVIRTAGANVSDHRRILPVVLEYPRIGGRSGRTKELPDDLYADRGSDSEGTRVLL